MGGIGNGFDNLLVEQLPSKAFGNRLRDTTTSATELPIYCEHPVIHLPPPTCDTSRRQILYADRDCSFSAPDHSFAKRLIRREEKIRWQVSQTKFVKSRPESH